MTPAETGSPVDSGNLGLCPMTPASDSQPATPASSCNTSHTQQSYVPGQKRARDRQEYTKWRMNYLRATENRNPKNRMSPTCVAALRAGEALFDIFVACKGEWAQVHIQREMTTRQRRGSRDCDAKMNKDQLLAHYCGNAELTDAIIAEKTSLGEWEPHPDAPNCEAGRLYKVWHSWVGSKETSTENVTKASISDSVSGEAAVYALSAMRTAQEKKKEEEKPEKPKPKPKPKREPTLADKKKSELKRQECKLRATLRECSTLLAKSEQDDWKFGVDKLLKHQTAFNGLIYIFNKAILLEPNDANIASMDGALTAFEKSHNEYTDIARRVRATLAPKPNPQPKAKATTKAAGKAAATPASAK